MLPSQRLRRRAPFAIIRMNAQYFSERIDRTFADLKRDTHEIHTALGTVTSSRN